jgi:hypothetical protein
MEPAEGERAFMMQAPRKEMESRWFARKELRPPSSPQDATADLTRCE